MSRDLRLAMIATLEDRASGVAKKMNQALERESDRSTKAIARRSEQTAQVQERMAQRTRSIDQRMHADRERLGIRSEQRIQREIQLTEASYNRLARAGKMSGAEQSRAYAAMQQRVASLRREMAAADQQQSRMARAANTGSRVLQGYQAGIGALAAVGYVVGQPMQRTMSYDRRLAEMSNTAYADRDIAGRMEGMQSLNQAIKRAVEVGGGSRDQAADTLDALIASGAMSQASAENLLPTLQKAAVATGASPTDLAQIAIRSMQTFGISEADIPKALDMAVKAGQEGGFEIKDMARWLPQQLAAASSAGMKGIDDFGALLAANQAAMITAGSTDEAGNNLVNLLAKLTSRETALAASKIEIEPGKSIDLIGTLSSAREQGMNALDAFAGIVDKVVGRNPEYQKLQQRMANTSDDGARRAIEESQAALLQGSAMGELFADRQATMGLLGYMNNRQYRTDIIQTLPDSIGTIGENHDLIASTPSYKTEQLKNMALFAESDGMSGLNEAIGDVAGKLAEYGSQYPGLASAMVTATHALNALAAAAAAASVIGLLRGAGGAAAVRRGAEAARNAGRGVANGVATGAAALQRGTDAARNVARGVGNNISTGAASSIAKKVGVGGAVVAGAIDAVDIITNDDMTGAEKGAAAIESVGSIGGSLAGAKLGAMAGALAGPVGVIVGGVVGGIAGSFLGEELAETLNEFIFSKDETPLGSAPMADAGTAAGQESAASQAALQAVREPQEVRVVVDVQNGNIVAAVNEENARQARRN